MSCTHMSRTRTAMIPDHINKASTLHMTLRVTLRCRRGTYGTGLGVVARLVPVWRRGRRGCLRGRRGTWRHGPSLCATGVALGDINRHFVWQAWHLWHWAGSGGALGSRLAPWAPRLFAWQALYLDGHIQLVHTQLAHTQLTHTQAWHFETSTVTLCGRRGTYGIGLAPVARLVLRRRRGRRGCLRGRRCTWTLTYNLSTHNLLTHNLLTRRRGTSRHQPSLCVAGLALMALGWLWWRADLEISVRSWKNKRACGPTIQTYINTHTYINIYIYICIHTAIHPSIHTCIHTYMHTYMHTTQLVHTQLTRTYSSTHNLLHTNPSPSLFPFLFSPCHLYLSSAACWKKLTCGVIRSFNFLRPKI